MSDCFVLYLLLTCMKKKTSGADKFTNNNFAQGYLRALEEFKVMPQDVIAETRIACLNRAAERMLELNRRKKHE